MYIFSLNIAKGLHKRMSQLILAALSNFAHITLSRATRNKNGIVVNPHLQCLRISLHKIPFRFCKYLLHELHLHPRVLTNIRQVMHAATMRSQMHLYMI